MAVTWYRGATRAVIDLLVIVLLVAPLYLYLLRVDAFDSVFAWSRSHEEWEIDELFALAFCLGLIAVVYAWRRLVDLRREMNRRQDAEAEAHRLARHDALTGLPNRRRFLEEFMRYRDGRCAQT